MIDRSIAPELQEIAPFEIPKAEKVTLANGIEVYLVEAGETDITAIEILVFTGDIESRKAGLSTLTNRFLQEGTRKLNAQEIAEKIDEKGAHLELNQNYKYSGTTLYCLSKHLSELADLLKELVYHPAFPEEELKTELHNAKQRMEVNMQKVEFLASREFPALLLGKNHPLSKQINPEDYDAFESKEFSEFHSRFYGAQNSTIIIAGKNTSDAVRVIKEVFEEIGEAKKPVTDLKIAAPQGHSEKNHYMHKTDAVQNAIRIGKVMPGPNHEDYHDLRILNVILGGYFGSRLMQKIREEKGYTYGISSSLRSKSLFSILSIATEVNASDASAAIDDIKNEIARLREELVDQSELDLVKSYITGALKAGFDGPFELLQRHRQLITQGQEAQYYYDYIESIKDINPERLRQLAIEYLEPNSLYYLNVGQE